MNLCDNLLIAFVLGHFTQMVWRGSREFGIGRAKGASGYVYIVANYNPRGNVRGHYAANVLRPVG